MDANPDRMLYDWHKDTVKREGVERADVGHPPAGPREEAL